MKFKYLLRLMLKIRYALSLQETHDQKWSVVAISGVELPVSHFYGLDGGPQRFI